LSFPLFGRQNLVGKDRMTKNGRLCCRSGLTAALAVMAKILIRIILAVQRGADRYLSVEASRASRQSMSHDTTTRIIAA
jgi:hypothetical protein